MKKQIILPIHQSYQNHLKQITKPAEHPIHLNLTSNIFSVPRLGFNFPTNRIFAKVTDVPLIIDSITYLQKATEQLEQLWLVHNSLIEEARQKGDAKETLDIFFGYYINPTYKDARYEDIIKNIRLTTDDALFHTERAKEYLLKIGNKSILRKLPQCFLRPLLIDYSFKESSYAELMPGNDHIPSWRE